MNLNIYIFYNSLIIIWICWLYLLAIWLFSSGFLIHKNIIYRNSSCLDTTSTFTTKRYISHSNIPHTPGCWFPSAYNKAVILLIDGLGYNFNNSNISNDILLINKLLSEYKNETIIYKLVSNASLPTKQRLSSLITGALPTFIDIGFNFNKFGNIIEDNLLNQLQNDEKRILFMSDNVANLDIYNNFVSNVSKIKDLSSGYISKSLVKEIAYNKWDIVLAHTIGIESYIRRYGFGHIETNKHFKQIKEMLHQIVDVLNKDNETILIVIGDHSNSASVQLVDDYSSFLFVHAFRELILFEGEITAVNSIDLVPTLSLLLGTPIPFSNIGRVISSLFAFPMDCDKLIPNGEFTCHEDIDIIKSIWTSITALRINVAQIQRYLAVYGQTFYLVPKSVQTQFDELLERYDRQWVLLNNIPSDDKLATIQSLKRLRKNYENYLFHVKNELEKSLIDYDIRLIISGSIVLCLTLVANITCAYFISSHHHLQRFCGKIFIGLLMGAITANMMWFTGFSFHKLNTLNDMIFLTSVTSIFVSVGPTIGQIIITYFTNKRKIILCLQELVKLKISLRRCALFVVILHFFLLFSKRFLINEELYIYYTLQTILMSHLLNLIYLKFVYFKQCFKSDKFIIIISALILVLMIRLSKNFLLCHELSLNYEYCTSMNSKDLEYKTKLVFISCFLLSMIVIIFLYYLSNLKINEKNSIVSVIFRYLTLFTCICLCGQWILSLVDPIIVERHLANNQQTLAKTITYSSAILLLIAILFPITSKTIQCDSNENYSSSLIVLSLCSIYQLSLYQQIDSNVGLFLILLSAAIYLIILNKIGVDDGFISTVIWYLISTHGFYATGHHNYMNSIPWNVSFITNNKEVSSNFLPIILNTFAVHLFCGLSVTLLATFVPHRNKMNKIQTKTGQILWEKIRNIILEYTLLNGLTLLGVSLSAAMNRHDPITWKLFAPRYIFQVINSSLTLISVLIGYLFCIRIKT